MGIFDGYSTRIGYTGNYEAIISGKNNDGSEQPPLTEEQLTQVFRSMAVSDTENPYGDELLHTLIVSSFQTPGYSGFYTILRFADGSMDRVGTMSRASPAPPPVEEVTSSVSNGTMTITGTGADMLTLDLVRSAIAKTSGGLHTLVISGTFTTVDQYMVSGTGIKTIVFPKNTRIKNISDQALLEMSSATNLTVDKVVLSNSETIASSISRWYPPNSNGSTQYVEFHDYSDTFTVVRDASGTITGYSVTKVSTDGEDNRLLEAIRNILETANVTATNQLNNARSQSDLFWVNQASNTMVSAKSVAENNKNQIVSSSIRSDATNLINNATPTSADIASVRTTVSNDNNLLDSIRSTMATASATAINQLNNAGSQSSVNQASNTMVSAKSVAENKKNQIVSSTIRSDATNLINNASPTGADIESVRSTVTNDNILLDSIRSTMATASATTDFNTVTSLSVLNSVSDRMMNARTTAKNSRDQIVSSTVRTNATSLINDASPTVEEIADARENITSSSPQVPTDESLLGMIRLALNAAIAAAQQSLDQVQGGSDQYLVDSAKKIIEDSKIAARSQRDTMVAASVRAEADILIEGATINIVNAQNIVDENATDPELLENVRSILQTANEQVQEKLSEEISQETLEQLAQLLIVATDRAKSLRDKITEISNETQDDVLKDVTLKQEQLSNEIQTRLKKLARTWVQKNLIWIIIGSVVAAIVLVAIVYAIFKSK
jgi:hypothetical protein